MIAYKKEGINLIICYTLEYLDTQKDLDYVNSGMFNKGEPWERYKKKSYDNIDEAFSAYMIYLVRNDIFDVRLFEEIILDGNTIQERYIEITNTTSYAIKTWINKSMYEKQNKLENKIDEVEKQNKLYQLFIKQFNAENSFYKFVKQ